MKYSFVYIMSNFNRTSFYIGVTNDIVRRVSEHKRMEFKSFTSRYKLIDLVYYEHFESISDAFIREKQLKNWHREWKINLIKSVNPEMIDLSFSELGLNSDDYK